MITLQAAEDLLKATDKKGMIIMPGGVHIFTQKELIKTNNYIMDEIGVKKSEYNYWLIPDGAGDPIGINNAHDLMMILK